MFCWIIEESLKFGSIGIDNKQLFFVTLVKCSTLSPR